MAAEKNRKCFPIAFRTNINAAEVAMKNIVYFDLETQRSADEVGGWNNISKMGMSIGVTFSSALGEYKIYDEKAVDDFSLVIKNHQL